MTLNQKIAELGERLYWFFKGNGQLIEVLRNDRARLSQELDKEQKKRNDEQNIIRFVHGSIENGAVWDYLEPPQIKEDGLVELNWIKGTKKMFKVDRFGSIEERRITIYVKEVV